MAPKKQKTQRNAFFFFMEEFREREEAQGRFYNTMAEVASAAGPEWQAMSLEQRKPYEMRKSEQKSKQKEKKYNALGEEVSLAKKREEEEERGKRAMHKYIEDLVVDGNDFATKTFYIAHVNHYCYCTAQNRHIPAEISIVRFSLQEGICLEDCYNVILDVGTMPIGYRLAAVTVSEETHNIPVPPHDDEVGQFSEKNIHRAFVSMTEFLRRKLRPHDYLPPVYVDDLNIEMAKDVFKHLHDEHDGGNIYNEFCVYSLSYLFFVLRNAAHSRANGEMPPAFPYHSIAQIELEKDVYDYVKGIACKFHDRNDCAYQHCSLSKSIRKAFIICDHTCYDLDINLIPGRHIPINSKSTKLEQRPSSQNDWVTVSRNNSRPPSSLSNGVRNQNSESSPSSRPWNNSSHSVNNNPEPPTRDRAADFEDAEGAIALLPTRAPEQVLSWGARRPQSRSMAMSIQPQAPPDMQNDFPALGVSRARTAPLGRGRGRMLKQ